MTSRARINPGRNALHFVAAPSDALCVVSSRSPTLEQPLISFHSLTKGKDLPTLRMMRLKKLFCLCEFRAVSISSSPNRQEFFGAFSGRLGVAQCFRRTRQPKDELGTIGGPPLREWGDMAAETDRRWSLRLLPPPLILPRRYRCHQLLRQQTLPLKSGTLG
jgi:hypothetical protein